LNGLFSVKRYPFFRTNSELGSASPFSSRIPNQQYGHEQDDERHGGARPYDGFFVDLIAGTAPDGSTFEFCHQFSPLLVIISNNVRVFIKNSA
jgi:hypothetical protein